MENIRYTNPIESKEEGESLQHRIVIEIDGKEIGAAEIDYFSKPLPLYQLTDLYVDSKHQSVGNASNLMDKVESFLLERKKPGVLIDATLGKDAEGMYGRRGWKEINSLYGRYVFNWPDDIDTSILDGFENRYTDHLTRGDS